MDVTDGHGGNYEGESICNQPNLFPIEIHLLFFDVIALYCDALRLTVFKCHQPRTEKVRNFSNGGGGGEREEG